MTMRRRAVRFRRSPHIVSFWRDRRLVFHNYASGSRVHGDPLVCELLDQFGDWRTLASVTKGRPRDEARAIGAIVNELGRKSMLERSDRVASPSDRAMSAWSRWNPEAGFFHFSTKDTVYETDVTAAEQGLRRQARQRPMPRPVKAYRAAPKVPLPRAASEGELARVLRERRTWRHFSRRALDLSSLSTLLELTWGVQQWRSVRGQGRVALKTSPSGGARHPIEAYVLALRVNGLPRGLYHYRADRHVLERLAEGSTSRQAIRYCGGQAWYGPAAALVIMTAVFSREQWRYRTARAYRAVLLDAGHLCQTFCLLATSLGLAPFSTMAIAESLVERDLGIDGISESAMYVAGVGTPPAAGWDSRLQRAALRR